MGADAGVNGSERSTAPKSRGDETPPPPAAAKSSMAINSRSSLSCVSGPAGVSPPRAVSPIEDSSRARCRSRSAPDGWLIASIPPPWL